MKDIILKEELLKKEHHVVKILFDSVSESKYDRFISTICSDIGWGTDTSDCSFPGDLDPEDLKKLKDFDGILFRDFFDKEYFLSYQEFYYYIKKAADRYIHQHPEKEEYISGEVNKYRVKHNCE